MAQKQAGRLVGLLHRRALPRGWDQRQTGPLLPLQRGLTDR